VCAPTVLASGYTGNQGALAVDSVNVYWVSGLGTVGKCASAGCGGTPTILASGLADPCLIAIDAANVYWVNFGTGSCINSIAGAGSSLMTCPIAGCSGSPTTLVPNRPYHGGLASDGAFVYFSQYQAGIGGIYKCAVTGCGGAPTLVTATSYETYGLAIDTTSVYFTTSDSSYTLWKCPLSGCVTPTALTTGANTYTVAVDATSVYWSHFTSFALQKCSITGCASPTTLTTVATWSHDVSVDGTNVFWAPNPLFKCSTGGCGLNPTSLYSGTIQNLAIDSTYVYFTAGPNGSVLYRTPK
jgi:hypothetical protein